jgi:hypothetical protein
MFIQTSVTLRGYNTSYVPERTRKNYGKYKSVKLIKNFMCTHEDLVSYSMALFQLYG